VTLAALTIALVLSVGAAGWRFERLEVDPWVFVRPSGFSEATGIGGITLPGVIVTDAREGEDLDAHEMGHTLQWNGLGLAFPLVYAATGGAVFEDYRQPDPWRPSRDGPNCPLLTFQQQGAFLLHCWR
jgi:hypothetical protein